MCISTGNRFVDIGIAVVLGAVTGGLGFSALATSLGTSLVPISVAAGGSFFAVAGALGGGLLGLASSLLTSSLFQQQKQVAQQQQQQALPQTISPKLEITGSGGKSAPSVLAAKIREINRERQLAEAPSLDTIAPAFTGLQLGTT